MGLLSSTPVPGRSSPLGIGCPACAVERQGDGIHVRELDEAASDLRGLQAQLGSAEQGTVTNWMIVAWHGGRSAARRTFATRQGAASLFSRKADKYLA